MIYSPSVSTFKVLDYVNQSGGFLSTYTEQVDEEWLPGADILRRVAVENSVNPLLLLLVYTFVFTVVIKRPQADALYRGWNEDLARFSSDVLRKKSAAMLQDSEGRTRRVLAALERVHGRMQPVLLEFRDYGLFFHHNLNARAIATLQDTYRGFDAEFGALQAELARAQEETTTFLASFEEPAPE